MEALALAKAERKANKRRKEEEEEEEIMKVVTKL